MKADCVGHALDAAAGRAGGGVMERLTNKHEADAQREEYERRLASGYPRNIPEERFLRLAAYEDTGRSPQACAEAREAGKVLSSCDISFGRLAELLSADKDGRLAVLPEPPEVENAEAK